VIEPQSGNIDRDSKGAAALRREARLRYDENLRMRNCHALLHRRRSRRRSPPYRSSPIVAISNPPSGGSSPKLRHPAFHEDKTPALKKRMSHTRALMPDSQTLKQASRRIRGARYRRMDLNQLGQPAPLEKQRRATSAKQSKKTRATRSHSMASRTLSRTTPRQKVRVGTARNQMRRARARGPAESVEGTLRHSAVEMLAALQGVPPSNPWVSLLTSKEQEHVAALTEAVRALEARLTAVCMPDAVPNVNKNVGTTSAHERQPAAMHKEFNSVPTENAAVAVTSATADQEQKSRQEQGHISYEAAASGLATQNEVKHPAQAHALETCPVTPLLQNDQGCADSRAETTDAILGMLRTASCQSFPDTDAVQIPTAPGPLGISQSKQPCAQGSAVEREELQARQLMNAGACSSIGLHVAVARQTFVSAEEGPRCKSCSPAVQPADPCRKAVAPPSRDSDDISFSLQTSRAKCTQPQLCSSSMGDGENVTLHGSEGNAPANVQQAWLHGTPEHVHEDASDRGCGNEARSYSILRHMQADSHLKRQLSEAPEHDGWSREAEQATAKLPSKTNHDEDILGAVMRTHLFGASKQFQERQQRSPPGASMPLATEPNIWKSYSGLPHSSPRRQAPQPVEVCPDPFSAIQMLAAQAYVPIPPPRAPCWAVALERSFRAAAAAAAAAAKTSSCSLQSAIPLTKSATAVARTTTASAVGTHTLSTATKAHRRQCHPRRHFTETAAQVPSVSDTSEHERAPMLKTTTQAHNHCIVEAPKRMASAHGCCIVGALPSGEAQETCAAQESMSDAVLEQHTHQTDPTPGGSSILSNTLLGVQHQESSPRQTPAQLQRAMMEQIDRLDTMEVCGQSLLAIKICMADFMMRQDTQFELWICFAFVPGSEHVESFISILKVEAIQMATMDMIFKI
jgi:hypothetical protein